MASIGEVADLARVSVATVSRVLNNSPKVKEETRQAVKAAIEELHYVPNMLGVGLRRSQSGVVIVLLTTISNLFYASMVEGVAACAAQYGYRILLASTNGLVERELEFYDMAQLRLAEGVLAVAPSASMSDINRYAKEVPIVRCCRHPDGVNTPMVLTNDEQSAYETVQYLLGLGHRHIAFMGIHASYEFVSSDREKGYRRAMAEAGVVVPEGWIVRSGYDFSAGLSESEELFKRHPELDAILCSTDIMAFNTIKSLKRMGIRVPQDVSVTGYDDSPFAMLSTPQITSVNQNSYDIGYRAMERLYLKINNPQMEDDIQFVPHTLSVRESTAFRGENK